jgi:glutaredoxin
MRSWLMTKPRRLIKVDFYTRNGCCLCDEALHLIETAGKRYPIELSLIDVDQDPALCKQHGNCVPVVAVNGRVRFHGRVNQVLLERLFHAESA